MTTPSQAITLLAERIQALEDQLLQVPNLRRGVVTAKSGTTPFTLTVNLEPEGETPGIVCTDSTVAVDDVVFVLVLPGGSRVSFGDAK
jgi:hypothetical protein